MIVHELTYRTLAVSRAAMQFDATRQGKVTRRSRSFWEKLALGVVMSGAFALGGCVSVNAPDKPIVIELNINIKADVVYKLSADAQSTVTDNPDIF